MALFYELEYVEAGRTGSGDAITLRYADDNGTEHIHVIDGGYVDDGPKLVDHIRTYYGNPTFIDHVILTHPDGDHAAGLSTILEEFNVGTLWINRPWLYAETLLPYFEYEYTVDGLRSRLKRDFPYTADLEKLADERGVSIMSPLQGAQIGPFTVLAPSIGRYLQLVIDSEKTPDAARKAMMEGTIFQKAVRAVRNFLAEWGNENLKGDTEGTSRENESSVVQLVTLCGDRILLTGDAGVESLREAHAYATASGVQLPGIQKFDVPHHGSRRNLSSEVLDLWLGNRLPTPAALPLFTAIISANRNDPDHPRKAVVRALIHRGGAVHKPEGVLRTSGGNAPARNWNSAVPLSYPNEQEE